MIPSADFSAGLYQARHNSCACFTAGPYGSPFYRCWNTGLIILRRPGTPGFYRVMKPFAAQ
jgi:hypothetical protein